MSRLHSFTLRQQVYFTNLSSTNARDSPEFVEFYAAKAYFGIDDLSPERCKKLPHHFTGISIFGNLRVRAAWHALKCEIEAKIFDQLEPSLSELLDEQNGSTTVRYPARLCGIAFPFPANANIAHSFWYCLRIWPFFTRHSQYADT
jgi:hypothetical protein